MVKNIKPIKIISLKSSNVINLQKYRILTKEAENNNV